ncbi:MAG: glutamate racemase [Deltaproteobacteria bacterium]|nr:glutamate racemase [Deltaproteobacteria bacterium]
MTDERPIGVFDSGVGGLTVLRALRELLPGESTVYLGDTARVPYGTRSAATVEKYALNNARTLLQQADLKALVVACNTATAVALPALRAALRIPVVGVIEPGARAAMAECRGGTIVVLGTAGTVRSEAYPRALHALGHKGDVFARACPLLVPLVEEGWLSGDIPRLVVEEYLRGMPSDTDTVVMGCTHYPLLRPVLRAALPERVALVDGAAATATEVAGLLAERGLARAAPGPLHRLLVTDAPEQLARLSRTFLGVDVPAGDVELVDVLMTA